MFYPKIQSVFKRTEDKLFLPVFRHPVFEYLYDADWSIAEKMDGVNVRVFWDGEAVSFAGRSANSSFNQAQLAYLHTVFPVEKFFGLDACYLFGEMVGKDCHTNRYLLQTVEFFLFDSFQLSSQSWQSEDTLTMFAERFGIRQPAKIEHILTLREIVEISYLNFGNPTSESFPRIPCEGIILRPLTPLFLAHGERVITKMKYADKFHESFRP